MGPSPSVSFPSDAHFQLLAIFHGPNEKHQNVPRPLAPHPDCSLRKEAPWSSPTARNPGAGHPDTERLGEQEGLTSGLR